MGVVVKRKDRFGMKKDGERKDRQGERDDSYLKKKLPSFTARWAEVIFSGEKQQVQPKVVLQLHHNSTLRS